MISQLDFYLSTEHDCSYLDRLAQNIFLDPNSLPNLAQYQKLLELGFRRSGKNLYRPHCPGCSECISVRVNVNEFMPKKSQKRCYKKNQDIIYKSISDDFSQEHFELYRKYLKSRHQGEGMDESTKDDYINFLTSSWSHTQFLEFRQKDSNHLVAVAVTDIVNNALSSVYTFFDTDEKYQKRSIGVYAILSQIAYAKSMGLKWVYLGYWIRDNQKMSYKNQYKPAQILVNNEWLDLLD